MSEGTMQPGVAPWRVGMDTGGTFTDLVAVTPDGEVELGKVPSTPGRPSAAVLDAVDALGIDVGSDVDRFVLGTTIATNAVLTRRGARTLFLATAGFEDVLYIQRIDRPSRYDLQWVKARPYAERRDTIGVRERILADGTVDTVLTHAETERVIAEVRRRVDDGIEAIAVAFLFAYVNDTHERLLAEALRAEFPAVPVSASADVAPVWREYERSSTTVIDAYVAPIVSRFVDDLEVGLDERRLSGQRALMKSNGGQVPLPFAARRPVQLVLSGLAGGMIAGHHWARVAGSEKAVTLDMGGTSADVGVVVDGHLQFSGLFEVEWGIPVTLPVIDVTTIGAGGGSIAAVDGTGLLRVGPQSAGADPGPACYGRGGNAATVTDANVVLGRLDPGFFLGGRLALDRDLAVAAVTQVAEEMNVGVAEAADAILAVSVENMAGAVRLVTVDRGYDYREFDLVAFGGAGPLHAAEIARRMRMRRVIVPPSPGLVSAFGAAIADERVDRRMTAVRRLDGGDASELPKLLSELAREAIEELSSHLGGPVDGVQVATTVACRYVGQNYEQEIRMYDGHVDKTFELAVDISPDAPDFVTELERRFHASHRRAYGYDMLDQPVESVFLGATALHPTPPVRFQPYDEGGGEALIGLRPVAAGPTQWEETRVYRRASLTPGQRLAGPAIVEEENSTTYVPPDFTCDVDGSGCLVLQQERGS